MPTKMYMMIALFIASGVIAQPNVMAANERPGPDGTAASTSTRNYSVRYIKGERTSFKKPERYSGTREVWVKGQLLVTDDSMEDVELFIEVENGECHSARIRKNGRFDVLLPAGAKARLIFQKTDHIAKEVLVDATDLSKNFIIRGEQTKVDFDVILIPEDHYPGYMLDGPVGTITFRRGTGVMKVYYHERLVAVE